MGRGPRWLGALVAVGLAAGLAAALPAEAAAGDSPSERRRFVTGWLPYWSPTTSVDSVVDHAGLFDEASPFWFTATAVREVRAQASTTELTAAVSELEAAGVPVVPTVTASMDAAEFASLLATSRRRSAHVAALVAVARRYGVAGLDLDYESINFGGTSRDKDRIRARYPLLVDELERALGRQGRLLSVTVPSRRSDADPNWWVYDYARLGAQADRLRLMTYDYSWSGGSPGPIAPVGWVDEVVGYAASRVDPLKISIGVPVYGRDWYVKTLSGSCPSSARSSLSRTTAQMQQFAQDRGIDPAWDADSASRTFAYRQRYRTADGSCVAKRRVWFDDAGSLQAKLRLVTQHQVRGVALWAFGNETPGFWRRMSDYATRHPVGNPTLRASAPRAATYGDRLRIEGSLRAAGHPVAGTAVRLLRRAAGATGWTPVASGTTGPHGQVAFVVQANRHATYRLAAGPTWSNRGARGSTAVRVSYAVDLANPVPQRRGGSTYVLAGRIGPQHHRVRVTKQLLEDGHWVDRGTVTAGADGRFRFLARARHQTTKVYRVVAAPGVLDRGTSARVRIRFR